MNSPNRPQQRSETLLLVLIAAAALTVVRMHAAWSPKWMGVQVICELLAITGLSFFLRQRATTVTRQRSYLALLICIAVVYPIVSQCLIRLLSESGEPFELSMLTGLLLTSIVLAIFSHVPRLAGTSILMSGFLLLFVTTMSSSRITLVLIGSFTVLAIWWLMGSYWNRLADSFVASTVERQLPLRVVILAATGLILLLLAGLIGSGGDVAVALTGFMPASGGTRWQDPHARLGVGDGDAMVAAQDHAMSFGPVESDLFLESEMPSLYDMVNDMYGDPPKPKQQQQRSIGLSSEDAKESHDKLAMTQRSGREFSAIRQKVLKHEEQSDLAAAAMFYVVGEVPLHLALERFDQFDGRKWTHSDQADSHAEIQLEKVDGKPWAYFARNSGSPIHAGYDAHAVKIINLETNRFPSPPQLTAVHIDKVDQPDFFGWSSDGVACMPVRDSLPQLSVLHLLSQGVNLEFLREEDFTARFPASPQTSSTAQSRDDVPSAVDIQSEVIARHLQIPSEVNAKRIAETSDEWTRNVPRGWRQVEAVVDRLRSDFVLDPKSQAPLDCTDVVSYFLEKGRGPDYLFAGTAAILLRELGYPTRLVSGFYAREDRFDQRAGQTTVIGEDVHVWAEVNIDGRTWVAIEPSPGYEPPREVLSWRQYLAKCWTGMLQFARHNFLGILATLALLAVAWRYRVTWLDALVTLFCRLAGRLDSSHRVLWTIRLLEFRTRLAGHPRPKSKTISRWHGALADQLPSETAGELQFALRSAESMLYRSRESLVGHSPTNQLQTACSMVERQVTASCFRRMFDDGTPRSKPSASLSSAASNRGTHDLD